MSWHQELNDFTYKLGWDVKHVGLTSINEKALSHTNGYILVPAEYKGIGRLYYRTKKPREVQTHLQGMEDHINLFFDVAFSLAADEMVSELLLRDFSFSDIGPWSKLGHRSAPVWLGWGEKNIVQPDSLFVSPTSIVNVEMKLNAKTAPKQMLAYVALTLAAEARAGFRQNAGLLFIAPQSRLKFFEALPRGRRIMELGLPDSNPEVRKILEANPSRATELSERMEVRLMTWSEIDRRIAELIARLGNSSSDATVRKLFSGFREQLVAHHFTDVR